MKTVYSFDVFDTVVTRITAHPKAVFFIIQDAVIQSGIEVSSEFSICFAQERIAAEKQARKTSKNEDVTINDIYEVLRKKFNLSYDVIDFLIATEIRIESDAVRVIQETAHLISELRKDGKRIVFISDMYLPIDVIKNILIEKKVFLEGDGLYVSGQIGFRKKTGSLFKHVLQEEDLCPPQICHAGDHLRNDYFMARLNGIKSLYLKRGRLNCYEKLLADCREGTVSWVTCQFFAGASRLARLEAYSYTDTHLRALHKIGANVVGPILSLFVYWLLHEAKKDNIKTLYFLARDGQIMMQVASMIAEKLGFSIELKYLYVSRQSLLAPSFLDLTETEIDWILHKDPVLTIALVAKRLSLDESVFQDRLEASGFPRLCRHSGLSPLLHEKLRQALLNDADVRSYVAAESLKARSRVVNYLRQQGLDDSRNWAVVDSGWSGRLQNAIEVILSTAGFHCQTRGYYFGVFDQHNLRGVKKGFLFSKNQEKHLKWGRPFTFLFETMTAAPHGTTLTYEKASSGEYRPVLDDAQDRVDISGIKAMREGVFDYVNALEFDKICYDEALFRNKAFCLLRRFYLKPSKSEAEAFGSLKYSNDQTDSSRLELAPVMSFTGCCKFLVKMLGQAKYAQSFWLNGSRARSSVFLKPLICGLEVIHFTLNSVYVKYLSMKAQRKC